MASTLAILLSKHNACANRTANSKGERRGATTWSIVLLLTSVLRFVNLHDPNSFKGKFWKLEEGLAAMLKPTDRVKLEVINCNIVDEPTKDGNENEED